MTRKVKNFPGLYREDCGAEGTRYRIVINYDREILQEYFYFRSPSKERAARAAAKARWAEIREVIPVITPRRFREIVRHPTESGITGVTRIVSTVKGREYEFWKAIWTTLKGERKSKQFSVNKYGAKEAKRLAIAARKAALDEIGPE